MKLTLKEHTERAHGARRDALKLNSLALATMTCLLLWAPQAHALKFTNQFVEFELPPQWKCGLEGAEWVCQSEDKTKKKDAIIVLAAKLKGDQDTLLKYQDYLKSPRKFQGPGGKEVVSEPKYANQKTVNGHEWADSMHTNSEIPNFFTRYMATTEKDIAVLVTYSVNKAKFAEYQAQFDTMMNSLRVFRTAGALNIASKDSNLFPKAGTIGAQVPGLDSGDGTTGLATDSGAGKPKADNGGGIGLIGLIVLAGAFFIYWKKKKAQSGG